MIDSTLTPENVKEILYTIKNSTKTYKVIAAEFNTTPETVRAIHSGRYGK